MQQTGLSFTFKRNNFTPNQYFTDTYNDMFDVLYFKGCWSLTAKIEQLARRFKLEEENGHFVVNNFDFLKELLWLLRDEIQAIDMITNDGICTTYSIEKYRELIKLNIRDLELLMFYVDNRIAVSTMFQRLSGDCFDGTGTTREQWISVCKAWGNYYPSDFEIILWIK